MKCLYQCDVLPVDLTSFNIIHSDFVKHSIIFFVTIFISFFSCTCYRYKTFIQYQKKKERKEKPPAKGKKKHGISPSHVSLVTFPEFYL